MKGRARFLPVPLQVPCARFGLRCAVCDRSRTKALRAVEFDPPQASGSTQAMIKRRKLTVHCIIPSLESKRRRRSCTTEAFEPQPCPATLEPLEPCPVCCRGNPPTPPAGRRPVKMLTPALPAIGCPPLDPPSRPSPPRPSNNTILQPPINTRTLSALPASRPPS